MGDDADQEADAEYLRRLAKEARLMKVCSYSVLPSDFLDSPMGS